MTHDRWMREAMLLQLQLLVAISHQETVPLVETYIENQAKEHNNLINQDA